MASDTQTLRHDEKPSSENTDASPISLRLGVLVAASTALIFLGILYMAAQRGRGPGIMLRDPAAHFGYSPFAGLLSHLGIFAMVSAAIVCFFAAVHARRLNRLLFWIGAFTLYIAVDDFMMLHKRLLPGIAVLGALGAARSPSVCASGAISLDGITPHYGSQCVCLGFHPDRPFARVQDIPRRRGRIQVHGVLRLVCLLGFPRQWSNEADVLRGDTNSVRKTNRS